MFLFIFIYSLCWRATEQNYKSVLLTCVLVIFSKGQQCSKYISTSNLLHFIAITFWCYTPIKGNNILSCKYHTWNFMCISQSRMTGAHISQNLKDQKTLKLEKKIQVLCEYELEHLTWKFKVTKRPNRCKRWIHCSFSSLSFKTLLPLSISVTSIIFWAVASPAPSPQSSGHSCHHDLLALPSSAFDL